MHRAQLFTDRVGQLTVWEIGRIGVLRYFVHTALVADCPGDNQPYETCPRVRLLA